MVDISNEDRKDHLGTIPLVGGIGLFVSLVYGAFVFGVNSFYLYVLASLIPIMIIGTIDGIQGVTIHPAYRVMGQIISCWIVIISTDIYVKNLGDIFGIGDIHLNQFGIPFTIFAVVGICNAFNMLDGKDGLLGSVSVIIMFSLFMLLLLNNIIYEWPLIIVLSILVFLTFNLSLFGEKRKIFLGDHGSNGLGFITAWSLIYLSQEANYITPISAIWFVFLPLTDAILTFIRRVNSSKSIFDGDRLHFHHILSDLGLNHVSIMIVCSFLTLLACGIAIASNLFDFDEGFMFYIYLTVLVILSLNGILRSESK